MEFLLLSMSAVLLCSATGCGGGRAEADTPPSEKERAAAEALANEPVGVPLGDFLVRDFHPTEGVRSAVSFELYAQVRQADAERFESLLAGRKHKIRSQVITATRVVPLIELDDPDLVTMRRRILTRLRRTLPELPVDDIVITEFSYTLDE